MTSMPELIDIGANLTHDSFTGDRDTVLQHAAAAGVTRMIVTGSSEQASRDAAALAARHPGVLYATAGVHPHHASDYNTATTEVLRSLAEHSSVVAIGECGLDFFRNFSPADAQREAFGAQLELAVALRLPVFLHQRDAHDDFMRIVEPASQRIVRGVAHCFTGTREMLHDYLGLGLYIGITGWICDERRGSHLLEYVGEIPDDRLLIETDAPYLLPRTLRPKPATRRNEPQYLPEVLRVVAAATGRSPAAVAAATTRNAERFFQLPERSG